MDKIESLMDYVADIAKAPTVQFGNSKYALFWTDHAKQRADEQGVSADRAMQIVLDDLEAINAAGKAPLAVECGYFCIRDMKNGAFVVCHLTEDNKRLRVVTFDGNHVLFPREGDLTYQITNDYIIVRIWSRI